MMKRYNETPRDLLIKRWPNLDALSKELKAYVETIVEDVRIRGDEAVRYYTKKFDNIDISELRTSPEIIQSAYNEVTKEQIEALKELKRRIEIVEAKRLNLLPFNIQINQVDINCSIRPLHSVGCYVPGGKATYPSSLVMNVVPAKIAGVNEISVCTPPGENGEPSALTLVAADICEVETVYNVGGIQAIASMAYGTETISKVDKIIGPGNKYVTAAKIMVSNVVAIDKPAGPSEIIIIADDTANAKFIALDLISQAEHGAGGILGLVTTSHQLADKVENEIEQLHVDIPRREVVVDVLSEGGFINIVQNIDDAVDFTNRFSPEHLEIHARNPREIANKISTAGLIQIGPYTPVSSTDYCIGVNHVLPTNGYGKISSGVTVLDFLRFLSIVEVSKSGLDTIRKYVRNLAEAEGLPNHILAVEGRFKYETD